MRIPGYRSLEGVAETAMSRMLKGVRQSDNSVVLLKVRSEAAVDDLHLRREFELTRELGSPYIATATSLEESTVGLVLVCDGARARFLEDAMLPLDLGTLLQLSGDLCRGLDAVHQAGLVHRDVKPTNVLIDPKTGRGRLTGFALAAAVGQADPPPGQPVGSLHYISPEQTGRTNLAVDGRSDLYSLGATVYELATGRPPFEGDPIELVHAHQAACPPNPASLGVPTPLADWILQLLQKAPDKRPSSASEALVVLELAAESLGLRVTPRLARRSDGRSLPLSLGGRSDFTKSETWGPDRFEELDALSILRASQAISSELSLPRVVERLLAVVMESAGADHSFLVLYDGDGSIRIDAESRLSKETRHHVPALEPEPDRHPIRILEVARGSIIPTIVPDAREDERFNATPYVSKTGLRSAMCLPIERNDKEIGLVFLGHTQASDAFAPRRTQFLSLLTAQFAISLENARGFARLESLVQRRTAALEEAKDRAVAADDAKSQFLAIVSHEIRTPLNAVIGMTALLLDSELSTEQRDITRTVRDSGDALLALINDLLDFSKIESGRLEFESIPLHVENCVAEAFALVNTQAEAKGIQLHREVGENVPKLVLGDVTRIRQILVNLLANAVKFSEDGDVQARVSCEPREGKNVLLRFEVSDTGIGVPPDRLDRLFVPFTQADASTTRNFGGTGLGLAICRRLAETMGGEIGCESVVGEGSTFWFTIPTQAAEATVDQTGYAEFGRTKTGTFVFDTELAERVPLRILVAEDNPVNQKLAYYLLERLGYRAEVVGNGREAVIAINRQRYDVVLMDVQMPEMDGLEASRQILRSIPMEDRPVIIAVTANTMQGDRERCLRAGMDHYVGKPIRAEELKLALLFAAHQLNRRRAISVEIPDAVSDILRASGTSEPAQIEEGNEANAARGVSSSDSISGALDPSFRAVSVTSDSTSGPLTRGVVSVSSSGEFQSVRLDQLRALEAASGRAIIGDLVGSYTSEAGRRLVEIQLASRTRDHSKLEAAAHALKGASAGLGGKAVAASCQQLESDAASKKVSSPALLAELETALTSHLRWLDGQPKD